MAVIQKQVCFADRFSYGASNKRFVNTLPSYKSAQCFISNTVEYVHPLCTHISSASGISTIIGTDFHIQHRRIHRPSNTCTHLHNQQQFACPERGSSRGKSGLRNFECFPPRKLPHAKMVHPGREPASRLKCSPLERRCLPHPSTPVGRHLSTPRFHHETEPPVSPEDTALPAVHQIPRKYSDRKPPCRFLYKVPARSAPDTS